MLYFGNSEIYFLSMYLIIYKYYICFMLITGTFVEEPVRILTVVNYDYLCQHFVFIKKKKNY